MTNLNGPDAYGTNDPLERDTTDVPMTRSDDVLNSGDPDAIRAEIERTRTELSYDVDVLAEKVNPAKIVQRRTDKVKSKLGSVKDKVMGVANSAKSTTGDAASGVGNSVGDVASSVGSAVRNAPTKAVQTAQGNPLAVGLIAFGVGWLAASLIPASLKERELATQAKEAAEPLTQAATEVAKEVGANLKEPAMEAVDAVKGTAQEGVEAVKGTAQEGVETVKAESQYAAEDVKLRAQEAKDNVQNS